MKIQYCSDLHLEFIQNNKFIKKHPLKPAGDILVMAGDIVPFAIIEEQHDFFNYLADNFETTYWVPGNHEYYYWDINTKSGTINEAIRSNVFLVNNQTIQTNKARLIFSTLWSAISPDAAFFIQRRMADFSAINFGERVFTPDDYNTLHGQCKNFIEHELAIKADTATMVITHHVPTFLQYPAKYKRDVLNEAFATELHTLIEQSGIDYWLYGHHHFNTPAFNIGKTKLITNQLGYIKFRENAGFKNDAVIEIV
jgi:predicted phosphohydrolase